MADPAGVTKINQLRRAGLSPEQIVAWETDTRDKFTRAGLSEVQINTYFGLGPQDTTGIEDVVSKDFTPRTGEDGVEVPLPEPSQGFLGFIRDSAKSISNAAKAGSQASITGLQTRRQLPDTLLPDDPGFVEGLVFSLAQAAGDAPVSIPTFFAGAIVTAPVGALAAGKVSKNPLATVVGGGAGGLFGGGAVSGFVTGNLRASYIQVLTDSEGQGVLPDAKAYSRNLLAAIAKASLTPGPLKAGAKEGAIGGVTALAGGPGRLFLKPGKTLAEKTVRQVTISGSEILALVGTASAIEGELPTGRDFADAAGLVFGLDLTIAAAIRTPGGLRNAQRALQEHYIRTGERPREAATRANKDRVFRQQIIGKEIPDGPTIEGTIVGDRVVINQKLEVNTDFTKADIDAPAKIIVDQVRHGKNAVAGAKEAIKKFGETAHSTAFGALSGPAKKTRKVKLPKDTPEPVTIAHGKFSEKIVERETGKKSGKEITDQLKFDYVNRLQYIVSQFSTATKAETGKRIDLFDNPGELAALIGGANVLSDSKVTRGIFDADGNKIIPSMVEILDGIDTNQFSNYMVARRTIEKKEQGFDLGFDPVGAELIVKHTEATTDFNKRRKDFVDWQNHGLKELKRSGFIDDIQLKNLIQQNLDMTPMTPVFTDKKASPEVPSGGFPVKKPLKKFKSGEENILDPTRTAMDNERIRTMMVAINDAKERMVIFNDKLSKENRIFDLAEEQFTAKEFAKDDPDIRNFIERNGLDLDTVDNVAIARAANKDRGDNSFVVFRKGKPIRYIARHAGLVASIQQMDAPTHSMLVKFLSRPSAVVRGSIALEPDFIIRNIIRGELEAPIINNFKTFPFVDILLGLPPLLGVNKGDIAFVGAAKKFVEFTKETGRPARPISPKTSKAYAKFLNNLAGGAAVAAIDARILNDIMRPKVQTLKQRAQNVIMWPAQKLAVSSSFLDTAARLAVFERALVEKGVSKEQAALRARRSRIDFSQIGAKLRSWRIISLFFTTNINGKARFAQAFKEHPRHTIAVMAMTLTVPALVFHFLQRDEQWYRNLTEEAKAKYLHIRLPGLKGQTGGPVIVRIPYPFEAGVIGAYVPQKIFDLFVDEDPDAAKEMMEGIVTSLSANPLPSLVIPVSEVGLNVNSFTGNDIVSQAEERFLPEERHTPYTSETAKKIASLLQAAPDAVVDERFSNAIAIDHMIRGYAGPIGQKILEVLEDEGRKFGFLDDISKPDPQLADSFIWGSLFGRSTGNGKIISDFYDKANEIRQIRNSLERQLTQFGETPPEAALNLIESILEERGLPRLDPTEALKAMGNLRKNVRLVQLNAEIEGFEKRQLIDDMALQSLAIADGFLAKVELTELEVEIEKLEAGQ